MKKIKTTIVYSVNFVKNEDMYPAVPLFRTIEDAQKFIKKIEHKRQKKEILSDSNYENYT